MKTFDKKDVFTLVTAEEAEAYIGKQGYFGDSFKDLERKIKEDDCDELAEIFLEQDADINIIFRPRGYESCYESSFGLFLPADKIKEVEEEKKYRPFKNVDEFIHILGVSIGEILIFRPRKKAQQKGEIHTILVGYLKAENGDDEIILGGSNGSWSLQDIFENLEWKSKRDGQWQPFGVEE